jgi:hypothetical protein
LADAKKPRQPIQYGKNVTGHFKTLLLPGDNETTSLPFHKGGE